MDAYHFAKIVKVKLGKTNFYKVEQSNFKTSIKGCG